MLNTRQNKILLDFYSKEGEYLLSNDIARSHGVSLRTIQSDIQEIRLFLNNSGAQLISKPSKGSCIIVENKNRFQTFIQKYLLSSTNQFNEKSKRINYIINCICNYEYVSASELEKVMYISSSCLCSDMKLVRCILKKYNLSLNTSHDKYHLNGNESDIRKCITKENTVFVSNIDSLTNEMPFSFNAISKILTESLLNHHFTVSDFVFQSLVVHIIVSLQRMQNGHYLIMEAEQFQPTYATALDIAREIFKACCTKYQLAYSENETKLLAINLQGKCDYDKKDYISKEINDFVFHVLKTISKKYNIDLCSDYKLRVALALHTTPLLTRAEYNIQMHNTLCIEIKHKFVLAFDLASVFAQELFDRYHYKLIDDEISYIALHFSASLNSIKNSSSSLNILLISTEKKSNTILIQQKFAQWFPKDNVKFDIVGMNQVSSIDYDDYNAVFTTESTIAESTGAVLINFFITDNEYNKIRLAISGFSQLESIHSIFSKSSFSNTSVKNKNEAIRIAVKQAGKDHDIPLNLYESVINHEQVSSTYFGNSVAMPHPNNPFTNSTFISVVISNNNIEWDENENARLIMLVCIEKNNPKALSIWNYLSLFMEDKNIINSIINNPTYDNFIECIDSLYMRIFRFRKSSP